jgi:NADPH:quinone reductase-like Zn-dependent oxidoreductase
MVFSEGDQTMKAAQIQKYSKDIKAQIVDIPIPTIQDNEVLVKVKIAAVNPLDILNISGSVKLIQSYDMPLVLGNELTGIVEKVGNAVSGFNVGDPIYTRLPLEKIGAFAEYVAVEAKAIWHLPSNVDFVTGAGAPLTGLTAYQGLVEELEAKKGQTVFIPGGSGSFGQMAVPIAKSMGLIVIVSGSPSAKERTLGAGADRYIDYTKEHYWEVLDEVDFVIDTLGADEFDRELSIIKPGGRLLSLRTGPNKQFALDQGLPKWKQFLFGLAGSKFDKKAKEKDVQYRFIFVRADGQQLKRITTIMEENNIVPAIDPTHFTIDDVNAALQRVAKGGTKGKVVIKF